MSYYEKHGYLVHSEYRSKNVQYFIALLSLLRYLVEEVFLLKSNGQKYTLQIYSEEVEELSTILSYALFSDSGEMLCMARTEFHSPDNPFSEAPYTQLIPEISSCALCKKKLSGECEGK